jgi:hypothetical protein
VAGGTLRLDAVFKTVEAEAEGARGVLRFSMASSAFVCACCTVTGEVACGEKNGYWDARRESIDEDGLV